jgi:hypothetical protein
MAPYLQCKFHTKHILDFEVLRSREISLSFTSENYFESEVRGGGLRGLGVRGVSHHFRVTSVMAAVK